MGKELAAAMADLDEQKVQELVEAGLAQGVSPHDLLDECREGIGLVGKRFETGEYYLSDLIMAGEIFKGAAALLTAQPGGAGGPPKGKVVLGTVQGDIHDIGKDIVATMLRGAGYEVIDLGVDVPADKFVEAARESGAPVVGMSGLLTISFDPMKETVAALKAAGLPVKIMIGGGSITEQVREYVGADALGADAQVAVALADRWIVAREVAR
ncbi:MAG: 5-methyltetrahydrofolate--homocysteine methyltransferase [Anaerolineaceae bacterium]|jgi:5-methyltetrahydrofolate--homocysteine methyltransferase|nr:cobalamin-dependent protein [Mesotoga sp.]NLF11530.1 5-methyltetrahydrofolate--homocysteine methyltransferase [Anaerolineaceae bacterium]